MGTSVCSEYVLPFHSVGPRMKAEIGKMRRKGLLHMVTEETSYHLVAILLKLEAYSVMKELESIEWVSDFDISPSQGESDTQCYISQFTTQGPQAVHSKWK